MNKYITGLLLASCLAVKANFVTVVPFGQLNFIGNVLTTNIIPSDSAGLQSSNVFFNQYSALNGTNVYGTLTNNTTGNSLGASNFLGSVITNTALQGLVITNPASSTFFRFNTNGTISGNLVFSNSVTVSNNLTVATNLRAGGTLTVIGATMVNGIVATGLVTALGTIYAPTNVAPFTYSTNLIGSNSVVAVGNLQRQFLTVTAFSTNAAGGSGAIWYSNFDGRVWTYPIGFSGIATNTFGPYALSTNSFWAATNYSGSRFYVLQTILTGN